MEHKKHSCNEDQCIKCNLWYCDVCRCYEGSLTTDCPGIEVVYSVQQQIYDNKLDFVDGKWEKRDG